MGTPKIAMILYTVREPAKEDLPGTLKRVREAGFEYVQWSGMPKLPAEEARKALDDAGLTAVAAHVSIEPFEEEFDETVAFWKTVGSLDVAPGGMMRDCKETLEDWLRGAERLDAVGAKLRDAGMRLSYHNHAGEFETYPGDERCKLDILYEETSPEHLFAELDTAWVHHGGADPAAYIRKYAGRCPVIHVKDTHGKDAEGNVRFAELGRGLLDWDAIFSAARESGVEWCIYEQDKCDGDVFDSVRASFDFLAENL